MTGWLLLFYNSCWLYALQFYIAGNFQVVRSHQLLKKFIYISLGFYRFRFLFFSFFFLFFEKCLFTLSVMLYTEQPTVLLARRHLTTMILNNFEISISILNIFQETQNFLVLTEPLINCIYLRTTDRHFSDQGNVRHSTCKLLKCDLVPTLNTSQNPSLRIFAAGKASLVEVLISFNTQMRLNAMIS